MGSCSKRIFIKVILLFITIGLNPFHAIAATPIKQLVFQDNALTQCILSSAEKHNWQTALQISKLKCHGMKINSLTGISALNNLVHLSLFNNNIEQADLRALTKLESINIANNKLKTVNLTGLKNLTTLYLFKNKLLTVDFTGLSKLKKIRITNNLLNHIELSPLRSLEKAYFFDNKLEDLLLQGLPKLKFVEVRQNPMPDEVYDRYDELDGITIVHDGNADDWK